MRIVLLTRSLDPGGAERQLSVLAMGLHDRGHDVSVFTFYGGGIFTQELLQAGVRVVDLKKSGRWDVLPFLWNLVRRLRSARPEVLYSFLPGANLIAAAMKPFLPRAVLVWGYRVSLMEMKHYDRLTRLLYRLEDRLARLPGWIIANSESGKKIALQRGFPPEKLSVVFNGIDTRRFHRDPRAGEDVRAEWGIGRDAFLIGHVGRLDPMKDHPTFLKAAALFREQWSNARFVCIGDGPSDYKMRLETMAGDLGLAGALQWLAPRGDLPAVYSGLDVFTLTSVFGEGFPNVVGEAMASETPCVVTDVGDTARIAGDAGIVIPPEHPEALAAGWLKLARMEERQRRELGEKLRARVMERFTLPRMIEETENCLSSLVSR